MHALMEEPDPQLESLPSSSSFDAAATTTTTTGDIVDPPPSSSSPSTSQVQEENNRNYENQQNDHHGHQRQEQESFTTTVSYRVNISISDRFNALGIRDTFLSCLAVLVIFWLFASMTLILGFYGSLNLQLGPNCSRLIQANTFFVQSMKTEELGVPKPGPMLYGFYKPPPLDVKINWTEKHNTFAPANFHKEWTYFLNNGSSIDVIYHVKSPISPPLLLIIGIGSESLVDWIQDPSLVEWIEDPPYPNTTLSWNIIQGSGKIQQDISQSSNYHIAVGNLNTEEVEVELEFTIKSIIYNTTKAYYKCSLGNHLCSLKLSLLGTNAAVLTSPGHKEDTSDVNWYIKLSYGTRWLTYFIVSGMMVVLILLAFKSCICDIFLNTDQNRTGFQAGDVPSERTPLLIPKDDDVSSWGSSYDSASYEEDDPEDWKAECSLEGKPVNEGENNNNNNPRRLCIICFDATRDCFFLPCGHCVACFTCGTRIAEEAGSCPKCCRTLKKVRKIFTV